MRGPCSQQPERGEGKNAIQLVATILEGSVKPPSRLCPELPLELSNVVVKCLKTRRSARFPNYPEITQALLPFSSRAPVSASLPIRWVAGVIDYVLLQFLGMVVLALFHGSVPIAVRPSFTEALIPSVAIVFVYFFFSEGLFGTAVGKAACGLRVSGADKTWSGLTRIFVRTSLFGAFTGLATAIPYGIDAVFSSLLQGNFQLAMLRQLNRIVRALIPAILFFKAQRANGYAGLHDLASNTRVIRLARAQMSSEGGVVNQEKPLQLTDRRIGPYSIYGLKSTDDERLLLGLDGKLNRRVWIRSLAVGSPSVSVVRRDLSRPTRLRWLGGIRSAHQNWDAYEAPEGHPFSDLARQELPWSVVRRWLFELAVEIEQGIEDKTLPQPLTLEHLWVTKRGQLRILDFVAREETGQYAASGTLRSSGLESVQEFLSCFARLALKDQEDKEKQRQQGRSILPVHGFDFLDDLRNRRFVSFKSLLESLELLKTKRPVVTSKLRLIHLSVCSLILLLVSSPGLVLSSSVLLEGLSSPSWRYVLQRVLFLLFGTVFIGGIVATLASFVSRGGVILGLLSIATVTKNGQVASRLKCLVRSLSAWSPVILGMLLLVAEGSLWMRPAETVSPWFPSIMGWALSSQIAGAVWAVTHPQRGLQDRIAGTYLVPR